MAKSKTEKIPFRDVFNYTKRAFFLWARLYPLVFVTSAVCAFFSALTPYTGIYLSARIIDELSGGRDPQKLVVWVIAALVTSAALALINAALSRWKACSHGAWYFKRDKIYTDKQFSMDFISLDDAHTNALRSSIKQSENWMGWGIGRIIFSFENTLKSIISIAGALVLTLSLFTSKVPDDAGRITVLNNPLFSLLIVILMLVITYISPYLSTKANSKWASYAEDAKFGNRYFSFFGFHGSDRKRALDMRIYSQEKIFADYLKKDSAFTPKSLIAKWARGSMGFLFAASSAVSQVFTGIVYIFVCLKALGGAFGIGAVTQYVGAISTLSGNVSSLISIYGEMKNNVPFLRTTYEYLDTPNSMYQGSLSVEKRSDFKYEIEFCDVSFKYPAAESYALKNIFLKFNIGERLAVVGMNGSGKTTFIKLLCRLYDPTEGTILLNGIDIRKYDYHEYMSIFSVVFQDFKLLSFELGQNVAASRQYNDSKVLKCLSDAGLDSRMESLPKGLNTCLYKDFEEEGVDISGGEAQKIALARALYKDAPFIILDEPTAALDPVAEYEVYSKFNDLVGEKTAVFISHRLSSCRFCHDIAVFHEGEIVQRGSHDSLLADENGKYHELWNAQAQYYSETAV